MIIWQRFLHMQSLRCSTASSKQEKKPPHIAAKVRSHPLFIPPPLPTLPSQPSQVLHPLYSPTQPFFSMQSYSKPLPVLDLQTCLI